MTSIYKQHEREYHSVKWWTFVLEVFVFGEVILVGKMLG